MSRRSGTPLSRKLAASAAVLVGRRVLVAAMSAIGTAVIARLVGVSDFGFLSAGLAAFWLATSVADFGFSLMLGRDLATHPDGRGRLLRTVIQVQIAWSLLPAAILVILAATAGGTTTRALVILALTPAVITGGIAGSRQVFIVRYETSKLAAIDLATNAAQLAATICVAALGGGAVAVALVISLSWIVNDIAVYLAALALMDGGRPEPGDRLDVLRRALPLGVTSVMASVYFSVDLLLLGWLVSGRELGYYAAACKVLSLLVVVPGLVTSAALPAFSESAADNETLRVLAGRVMHWLYAVALPVCVGAAIFARPLVRVAFGQGYGSAVPLVRILAAAAVLTMLANVLGTVLLARRMVAPMLVQNGIAIIFNVSGNLALVPRYGVTASAWLTVATEAIVCAGALFALRGSFGMRPPGRTGMRPAAAVGGLAVTGLLLKSTPLLGIPAAGAVFCLLLLMLGDWPAELQPHRRQPGPAASGSDREVRTALDVIVARPAEGGVGAYGARASKAFGEAGHRVVELPLAGGGVPAWTALVAFVRATRTLRAAALVHVELGANDLAAFWFLLFASLARPVTVTVHDAPRVALAPASGLVGGGSRLRDVAGHRLLSPLLDALLLKLFARRIRVAVVLSQKAAEGWRRGAPRRVAVAEHGADPPTATTPPSRGGYVLFAGYVGPSKGVDVLLDAWREAGEQVGLPLVIAGSNTGGIRDRDYEEHLRRLSAGLPVPPDWRGFVADDEFTRLCAEAAIVAAPYRRSNPVSGVIVRAMVERRAIVATRVPATLGSLQDGVSALLVGPGDSGALSAALLTLAADPGLRDRLGAGVRIAAERYTWPRYVAGVEEAWAEAM